jgi:hypothetical protein
MTRRERSRKARREWQRLVSEQGRSGQGGAAFCRERKLCASHCFWRKKRLRASPSAKFVEVKWATAAPVLARRAPRGWKWCSRMAGGCWLWPSFDATLVRVHLAVVESGTSGGRRVCGRWRKSRGVRARIWLVVAVDRNAG